MAIRKGQKELRIWINQKDYQTIKNRANETYKGNISKYCRKMLLNGEIKNVDVDVLRSTNAQLGILARDLYQIAQKLNFSDSKDLSSKDAKKIKDAYYKDWAKIKQQLIEAIKTI